MDRSRHRPRARLRIAALVVTLTLVLVAPSARAPATGDGSLLRTQSSGGLLEAPHYVVVDDAVRELLAATWDDVHADQHERAYCLAYVVDSAWGQTVYRVWAASPAIVVESHPTSITSRCPRGPAIALLHTHPPATCSDPADCRLGGVNAYECFPSVIDELTLLQSREPFNLVQCDRHALVPYWPR